jgi:hypothetical protein
MLLPRQAYGLVRYKTDKIFAFGGFAEEKTARSEQYSEELGRWESIPELPRPALYVVATVHNMKADTLIWITAYDL